jgi:hypothetical protein
LEECTEDSGSRDEECFSRAIVERQGREALRRVKVAVLLVRWQGRLGRGPPNAKVGRSNRLSVGSASSNKKSRLEKQHHTTKIPPNPSPLRYSTTASWLHGFTASLHVHSITPLPLSSIHHPPSITCCMCLVRLSDLVHSVLTMPSTMAALAMHSLPASACGNFIGLVFG